MQRIKRFLNKPPEKKKESASRKVDEIEKKYDELVVEYMMLHGQYMTLLDSYEEQMLTRHNLLEQQQAQDERIIAKLLREKSILKKTIKELDMRVASQRNSLTSKDETIKKLFQFAKVVSERQANQVNQLIDSANSSYNVLNETAVSATSNRATTSSPSMKSLISKERLLNERISSLRFELRRKESELEELKSKYETSEGKERNMSNYVSLLKETLATRAKQAELMETEANEIKQRLCEKDAIIAEKVEKIEIERQARDNMYQIVRAKEELIERLEARVKENEAVIGRLFAPEHVDMLNKSIKVLNLDCDAKNQLIHHLQNDITYLKEEVARLQNELSHRDMHIQSLETSLMDKNVEIETLEKRLNDLEMQPSSESSNSQVDDSESFETTIKGLRNELEDKETLIKQQQAELDALKRLIDEHDEKKRGLKLKLENHINTLNQNKSS